MLNILPPELWQRLMAHLDLYSMLRLRMTCRALYNLTAPRDAWISLVRGTAQQFHIPSLSEESIEDYATKELEEWVIRRHIVQSIWNSQEGPRFQQRRFNCPSGKSAPVLLPGGRWLLTNDKTGALYATDLNAVTLERKRLISPGSYIEGKPIYDPLTSFTYWIDPTVSRLTFRVALWSSFRYDRLTRILIYEIQLSGHADKASLVARPIRTIIRPGHATAHLVAIDGQHLIQWAFTCRSADRMEGDDTDCVRVFRYDELSSSDEVEPVTVKLKRADFPDMYLLPGRIVFTSQEGLVSIYTIPTIAQEGKNLAPLHEISAFNQRHAFDPMSNFRSTIHHVSSTCTTVLYSFNTPPEQYEIKALKIPHEWSKEPVVIPIFTSKTLLRATRIVDVFRTISIDTTSAAQMDVSSLSWKNTTTGELEQSQVVSRRFDLPRGICDMIYAPFGGFDAGLGRVVLYSPKYAILEVYDTIIRSLRL